jgi:hypothetical protein
MNRSHLNLLFSDAYQWLCKSRKNHPPCSDIWSFRLSWKKRKESIVSLFHSGTYEFDLKKKITLSDGDRIAIWSSQDALVLKVLTGVVQEILTPFSLDPATI